MLGRNLRLPADLVFGHPPGGYPETILKPSTSLHEQNFNIQLASNRMKRYYDTRSDRTQFSRGEAVWLYNPKRKKGISPKFSCPWEGPHLVTEQINDLLSCIQKSPHAKEK
jgi:hypothetical protein